MAASNPKRLSIETKSPPYVARFLAVCAASLVAAIVLAAGVVRCPTALVFGIPCPACGTTRALGALVRLDVGGAFRIHPVAPVVFAAFAILGGRAAWLVWTQGSARSLTEGKVGRAVAFVLAAAALAEVIVWALRWFGLFGGPVAV